MGGNVKGLNDYLQILKSPDIYPDIAGAGFFMSPAIAFVSTLIAYAGMIAMLFILLRIGADVLLMSGLGNAISNPKASGAINRFSSFENSGKVPVGQPWEYIKGEGKNIILMLAFVGLMISGYMLPLAGTVTASIGAVVTKVSDINPVPYIEAVDLTNDGVVKSMTRSSLSVLMKDYSRHYGNMVAAKHAADKDNITETDYKMASKAYYNSYYSADIYANKLKGELHNIRARAANDSDRKISREEEELRNFNYHAHKQDLDGILIAQGASNGGDSSLKGTSEAMESSLSNLDSKTEYEYKGN